MEDIAAIYNLIAEGHLDPLLSEITFEEIADRLGSLERHEVNGRIVANFKIKKHQKSSESYL